MKRYQPKPNQGVFYEHLHTTAARLEPCQRYFAIATVWQNNALAKSQKWAIPKAYPAKHSLHRMEKSRCIRLDSYTRGSK